MSKPIYMSIHDMEWHETAQAVKTMPIARKPDTNDKFIESHELSLLSLLVRKHPERAAEFLRRLRESMKAA